MHHCNGGISGDIIPIRHFFVSTGETCVAAYRSRDCRDFDVSKSPRACVALVRFFDASKFVLIVSHSYSTVVDLSLIHI